MSGPLYNMLCRIINNWETMTFLEQGKETPWRFMSDAERASKLITMLEVFKHEGRSIRSKDSGPNERAGNGGQVSGSGSKDLRSGE